jgi:hypothetical protein
VGKKWAAMVFGVIAAPLFAPKIFFGRKASWQTPLCAGFLPDFIDQVTT